MMYELMQIARREGLLSLESHLADPHKSAIFSKYTKLSSNHHLMEFICGALTPIVEGTAKPEQLPALMEAELKVLDDEHHAPIVVLSKTTDALPGFGIVAACWASSSRWAPSTARSKKSATKSVRPSSVRSSDSRVLRLLRADGRSNGALGASRDGVLPHDEIDH